MNAMTLCFGILVMVCQDKEPPKPTVVICPPVVEWRAADQAAAATELQKLPAGHPLRTMAVKAIKQRDLVKTCQSQKTGVAR